MSAEQREQELEREGQWKRSWVSGSWSREDLGIAEGTVPLDGLDLE